MEKKLYAIGEALIDFIPQESGRPMKDVFGILPESRWCTGECLRCIYQTWW